MLWLILQTLAIVENFYFFHLLTRWHSAMILIRVSDKKKPCVHIFFFIFHCDGAWSC